MSAFYSYLVAVDQKPTLCLWWRQCGGIRLAIGGQKPVKQRRVRDVRSRVRTGRLISSVPPSH